MIYHLNKKTDRKTKKITSQSYLNQHSGLLQSSMSFYVLVLLLIPVSQDSLWVVMSGRVGEKTLGEYVAKRERERERWHCRPQPLRLPVTIVTCCGNFMLMLNQLVRLVPAVCDPSSTRITWMLPINKHTRMQHWRMPSDGTWKRDAVAEQSLLPR